MEHSWILTDVSFFYWLGVFFSGVLVMGLIHLVLYPFACSFLLNTVMTFAILRKEDLPMSEINWKMFAKEFWRFFIIFIKNGVIPIENQYIRWSGLIDWEIKNIEK